MAMMEQLRTPGASRSAHEINRRVRRIEMENVQLGVTAWGEWEANNAVQGYRAMVRQNAQTNAVPIATVRQAQRTALTGRAMETRHGGQPVESSAQRGRSTLTAEHPISAGLATWERMPDGKEELNGGALAQTNGQMGYNGVISPTTAPAGGSRSSVLTRRILSMLRIFLLFPFTALRQLYWLMDPDAKIRSQGLQTVGSVVKTHTSSRVFTNEAGREQTVYTHYVTYRFDGNGGSHSGEKKVGSLRNLKEGSPIRVYYLPNTYPPHSAIDWEPLAVA